MTKVIKRRIKKLKCGQSTTWIIRDPKKRMKCAEKLAASVGKKRRVGETFAQLTKRLKKKHGLTHDAVRELVAKYAKK